MVGRSPYEGASTTIYANGSDRGGPDRSEPRQGYVIGGNLQTDFPSAEAGKTAYYALRWICARGDKGPWSEVCAAKVAA